MKDKTHATGYANTLLKKKTCGKIYFSNYCKFKLFILNLITKYCLLFVFNFRILRSYMFVTSSEEVQWRETLAKHRFHIIMILQYMRNNINLHYWFNFNEIISGNAFQFHTIVQTYLKIYFTIIFKNMAHQCQHNSLLCFLHCSPSNYIKCLV